MKPAKKKETAVSIPQFESADLNSYDPIGPLTRELKVISLLEDIKALLQKDKGSQS